MFFQAYPTVQVSLTLFLDARAYTRNLPVIDCTPVTERQPLVSQQEIGGREWLHQFRLKEERIKFKDLEDMG